jgi:pilus assembly protein Flp/PilA
MLRAMSTRLPLPLGFYLRVGEHGHGSVYEDGQGMVEYALILVLVAAVAIAVLGLLGNQVRNVFRNISSGLVG